MNILDENVRDDQRQLLRSWGIRTRQIGQEIGHKGLSDEAIISLLHQIPRPTFFTRDDGFDRRSLCHPAYCLVYLAVGENEFATFVRRFLRHSAFKAFGHRRGTVARVSQSGIHVWHLHGAHRRERPLDRLELLSSRASDPETQRRRLPKNQIAV